MHRIVLGVVCLTVLAVGVPACGGGSGGGGGGGGGPPLGDLTVVGTVVFYTGGPAPNVAVVIAGQGPFVSDGAGKFVVENVPVPYDAIVFDGPGGGAEVWRGLTRPDPTFTLGGDSPISGITATVDGKVSGGAGLPVPPNHETEVGFGVEDAIAFATATPDSVTGLYSTSSLAWLGPLSSTLHISALQYSVDPDGMPVTFTGYGSISAPIFAGDTLMNQDIVMGPVGTTTISGTVTTPPGLSTLGRTVFARLPGNGIGPLPPDASAAPNFSLQAPEVAGVARAFVVQSMDAVGNVVVVLHDQLPAPTTNLAVTIPTATGLAFPVDGVTGVGYGTDFQITPSPGDRFFRVTFRPSVGPGPTIRLITTASTFRIPDLSAYGLAAPPGATYEWTAAGIGPAATIDDAAVPLTFVFFFPSLGGSVSFAAQTDTWEFTFGS